ncbi:hypothetical protein FBU30_002732, partial [Linnemannia zychae]
MATLPGSDVFLALVKLSVDIKNEQKLIDNTNAFIPLKECPPLAPKIRSIVEDEFPNVFPNTLSDGLLLDH